MAVTSFIPKLWSARLLAHLDKAHVVANLVNRDYEGEIKAYGDTVKINQIGAITVSDYTKNTDIDDPEELSTTEKVLTIDKQKYFNFQIDDVDAAQVRTSLMDAAMQRAAYALAATLYKTNIYEELIKVKVKLDEKNVPTIGRFLIIPPDVHGLLLAADLIVGTGGAMAESITKNGFVGTILGFDVYLSNNMGSLTNGNGAIAGVKMACTFAEQIVQTEAYRMEKRFADAVKGLNVFGCKVIYPDALVCLKKTNP